jgi:hypothetical protein
MKTLSKTVGIFAIVGALLLGGMSFPHETKAAPQCLVKRTNVTVTPNSKPTYSFTVSGKFQPKLQITFQGYQKVKYPKNNPWADATVTKAGQLSGHKSFQYSTKKQTKTLVLSSKQLASGKYSFFLLNGGKKDLRVYSFCLYK